MTETFLVEAADGTMARKPADELEPEDLVVFDGQEAIASLVEAQAALEAEIAAAGGFDLWRDQQP